MLNKSHKFSQIKDRMPYDSGSQSGGRGRPEGT